MSLEYFHDLASILAHKIEWMIAGTTVSVLGINAPSIAPTLAQREIMDLSKLIVTWGDVFTATGWFIGVIVGYYSVVNLRSAVKLNNLNIKKVKKELSDD